MSSPVDVLKVMRLCIFDLDEKGFPVDDVREALDATAELIKAAKNARASLQHMRGPEAIIHARTAELDAAIARIGADARDLAQEWRA